MILIAGGIMKLKTSGDCRKEFEKHCERINFPGSLERYEDDYKSNDTYILWIGFKAGWFQRKLYNLIS